jgi:hypothetical protein
LKAKRLSLVSGAVLGMVAVAALIPTAAHAEEYRELAYKSCDTVSVGTEARGAGTQTHYQMLKAKKFPASSTPVTRAWYSGQTSGSTAVHTTASFQSARSFCDW